MQRVTSDQKQPYNRMQDQAPLWTLHQLWIQDKHQFMPLLSDVFWQHRVNVEGHRGEDLLGEILDTFRKDWSWTRKKPDQ